MLGLPRLSHIVTLYFGQLFTFKVIIRPRMLALANWLPTLYLSRFTAWLRTVCFLFPYDFGLIELKCLKAS